MANPKDRDLEETRSRRPVSDDHDSAPPAAPRPGKVGEEGRRPQELNGDWTEEPAADSADDARPGGGTG